jgi:hypothetical protein
MGMGGIILGLNSAGGQSFFYEHPMHANPSFIPASEALVRKDYKYFYWPDFKYDQLFDMKNDPGEMNDLSNSTNPVHQKKLNEMRRQYVELKMMAHSNLTLILQTRLAGHDKSLLSYAHTAGRCRGQIILRSTVPST